MRAKRTQSWAHSRNCECALVRSVVVCLFWLIVSIDPDASVRTTGDSHFGRTTPRIRRREHSGTNWRIDAECRTCTTTIQVYEFTLCSLIAVGRRRRSCRYVCQPDNMRISNMVCNGESIHAQILSIVLLVDKQWTKCIVKYVRFSPMSRVYSVRVFTVVRVNMFLLVTIRTWHFAPTS